MTCSLALVNPCVDYINFVTVPNDLHFYFDLPASFKKFTRKNSSVQHHTCQLIVLFFSSMMLRGSALLRLIHKLDILILKLHAMRDFLFIHFLLFISSSFCHALIHSLVLGVDYIHFVALTNEFRRRICDFPFVVHILFPCNKKTLFS